MRFLHAVDWQGRDRIPRLTSVLDAQKAHGIEE